MQLKPKKKFGQNFLINKEIIKEIVKKSGVKNEDVIEIGPGLGALTNLLINEVKTLNAYEVDTEIYSLWINKDLCSNIKFFNLDFLETNLESDTKKVVVGNIPYNITSPIIFKLIRNNKFIKHATIMVQKEVGERLLAAPNSKEYSKLSVAIQSVSNLSKILIAKASDFNPTPSVDSMVVRINFDKEIDFDLEKYLDFIKLCFQFKRKTLVNNLLTRYKRDKINAVFEKNNISLLARAENLDINQYKKIFADFLA